MLSDVKLVTEMSNDLDLLIIITITVVFLEGLTVWCFCTQSQSVHSSECAMEESTHTYSCGADGKGTFEARSFFLITCLKLNIHSIQNLLLKSISVY